jgi:hypothetical protein
VPPIGPNTLRCTKKCYCRTYSGPFRYRAGITERQGGGASARAYIPAVTEWNAKLIEEQTHRGWHKYGIAIAVLALAALASLVSGERVKAQEKQFCWGANLPGYISGCEGAYEYKNAVYAGSGDGPPCLLVFDMAACAKGSSSGGWGVYISNGSQYGSPRKASIVNLTGQPLKVYGAYWTAPAWPSPPPPPPSPTAKEVFLSNSNTAPAANITTTFGESGDMPIVGDWDSDGDSTIGLYRPSTRQFFLSNSNTAPAANITTTFGESGDMPIVGDWDSDGDSTIGLYRVTTRQFFLSNSNTSPAADISTTFGETGDRPIVGDWDNDGDSTIGLYR